MNQVKRTDDDSARKVRLAEAGTTYNYALAVIYDKGYKVFLYPDPHDEGNDDLWAIKDGWEFVASNPLTLLGLIGIWERFGDDWQQGIPGYYHQLFERTFPDDDYASLDDERFDELVQELRIFFNAIGESMPSPLTRKSLAEFMRTFSRRREDRAN